MFLGSCLSPLHMCVFLTTAFAPFLSQAFPFFGMFHCLVDFVFGRLWYLSETSLVVPSASVFSLTTLLRISRLCLLSLFLMGSVLPSVSVLQASIFSFRCALMLEIFLIPVTCASLLLISCRDHLVICGIQSVFRSLLLVVLLILAVQPRRRRRSYPSRCFRLAVVGSVHIAMFLL